MPPDFEYDRFSLRLSRLAFLSRRFRFYDQRRRLIAFAKIEDNRVLAAIDLFADKARQQPLLWMRERPGYPPTWDLFDPASGNGIGAVRQRPWKSLFKEEWTLLDSSDREMGRVRQRSLVAAAARRLILFVPTRYDVYLQETRVGTWRQNANPFMPRVVFDVSGDTERRLDRRFVLAVAIVLMEYLKRDE
jgi:hypothetical protein